MVNLLSYYMYISRKKRDFSFQLEIWKSDKFNQFIVMTNNKQMKFSVVTIVEPDGTTA